QAVFFFSSRRRHTRFSRDWSSDVCSSDLQTAWALGLATNHAAGTSGAHGSMNKSWNMAHAARCGLLSALLASKGFTSTEQAIERSEERRVGKDSRARRPSRPQSERARGEE